MRLGYAVTHPRLGRMALRNRLRGYAFSAVRRCRTCDHTTPSHYGWCPRASTSIVGRAQ